MVSLIGPHNSGKSHLLSSLFGCNIAWKEKRTLGITMSLARLKVQGEMKNIVVLDTEGTQKAKGVKNFDVRLIFYIMCVSHVVLLCNKGQMNSKIFDTVKLAIDSMINAKQNIVAKPQVYVVLTQLAHIKENTNEQCVRRLKYAIEEYREQKEMSEHNLNRLIEISEHSVFPMEVAFSVRTFGPTEISRKQQLNHTLWSFSE